MFFKKVVLKNFANLIGKHQCWSMGPSIKDVGTLGGRGVRQKWTNADRGAGGRGWLAECGRPLGKKIIACHICEIYSDNLAVCLYIKFSFCLYSIGNVWNAM